MDIALVTCRELPTFEVDDRPLFRALALRGAKVHHPAWDAAVDWSAYDGVVVRTTWDYWTRGPEFAAWLDRVASHPRLGNPVDVLRWSLDKRYLRQLQALGVPIADTEWIAPGELPDLGALLARRGWHRAFLKPAFGASASGTMRFDADADGLAAATSHLAAHGRDVTTLLQPYLESVETFGELSAIFFAGAYSHGVRKVPRPGDFRVQDDHGGTDAPYAFDEAERRLAIAVLDAARQVLGRQEPFLYARVDLLRDAGGGLVLTELELVEPSLFFRHAPAAADHMADVVVRWVREGRVGG